VHEEIAIRFRLGRKSARNQDWGTIEGRPGLPVLVSKAINVSWEAHADSVDAKAIEQVRRNLTQHLEGLPHSHRSARGIKLKCLPQLINRADVDSAARGRTEVQRRSVALTMIESSLDPFA